MSWFHVPTQHYLANTPDSCKVSLTRLSGRASGQVGIRIAIGTNVLEAMGVSIGDHMRLLWGRDEDVGKVRLEKSETGVTVKRTRESKYNAGYMTFTGLPSIALHKRGSDRLHLQLQPQTAQRAEWQADGNGGVVITLPPEWFAPVKVSREIETLKALTAVPMPSPIAAA